MRLVFPAAALTSALAVDLACGGAGLGCLIEAVHTSKLPLHYHTMGHAVLLLVAYLAVGLLFWDRAVMRRNAEIMATTSDLDATFLATQQATSSVAFLLAKLTVVLLWPGFMGFGLWSARRSHVTQITGAK